ncbi:ATPase family associated with various cellular activities (AAA) [Methylomagnum ishizawai]|uniref:ATPase family associated with various cellular activities (AAA) n=1 Tax=Methylomagnum ishizawai TaxID=1760988 RepID=A0A1Y6D4U5_9GAMM|nr:ATP-binding protein [Methylomagnum ishizawai]SMF97687.1 ATPase family associated with various cellular activities (AAA) [Methylomagnum ishizawai]
MDALAANARDLEREMAWLAGLLDTRFKRFFRQEPAPAAVTDCVPPDLDGSDSPYAGFLRHYRLGFAERVVLALALAVPVRPQLLDIFFLKNQRFDRRFTEFGGIHGAAGDFLPTVETALFLLAEDLAGRFALLELFGPEHFFSAHHIFRLDPGPGEPLLKAPLRLAADYLALFTTGQPHQPGFGADFPARLIQTRLDWDDLVLHPGTRKQVEEIDTWLRHGRTLLDDWGMAAKLRPGFRSLFYGPPGTGKTMTACLLGQSTGHPVYKIDLAAVVSKYIGETEKNLAKVFDQAEHKGWILFFDEADALFGKRGETKDAHDRYANQETAFLLQRLETFDGVAILASNFRDNLDEAFSRRFESVIYFPLPRPEERMKLWRQGFPVRAALDRDIDLDQIAREHELSGSAIMNAIRYAALEALRRDSGTISLGEVQQGIRREYAKERKGG